MGYLSVSVDVSQSPYCLPNAYTLPQNIDTLQFIEGTEPTEVCTTPTTVQSVPVPSVIGLDQASAALALEEAGFYVDVRVAISTQPPGTVIYQRPSAGTDARADEHRADHDLRGRADAVGEPLGREPGGPGRPRLTNGSSATKNRQARSRPTRTPTRTRGPHEIPRHRCARLDPDRRPPHEVGAVEGAVDDAAPGRACPAPSRGRADARDHVRPPSPAAPRAAPGRAAARRCRTDGPAVTAFSIQWFP